MKFSNWLRHRKLTSAAIADSDTLVGTGTLAIAIGAESFTVEIDTDNSSLAGIRDSINNCARKFGGCCDDCQRRSGSFLIFSGDATGSANSLVITQSGGDGGLAVLEYDPLNGLNGLTESVAAQDALVRVDGLNVSSNN